MRDSATWTFGHPDTWTDLKNCWSFSLDSLCLLFIPKFRAKKTFKMTSAPHKTKAKVAPHHSYIYLKNFNKKTFSKKVVNSDMIYGRFVFSVCVRLVVYMSLFFFHEKTKKNLAGKGLTSFGSQVMTSTGGNGGKNN